MTRVSLAVCLVVLLGLVAPGCSKDWDKDAQTCMLEGRVLNSASKPIAGLKVIARLAQPVNGNDMPVKAIPRHDGVFTFDRLIPETEYTIEPFLKDYKFSTSVSIKTGRKDTTTMLPQVMSIRWMQNKEGIIVDTYTELEWLPDQGKAFVWEDAAAHVKTLKAGGYSDWRLPIRYDLSMLFVNIAQNGKFHIDSLFQLGDCCVWSGESCDASSAKALTYIRGTYRCENLQATKRVLAVRGGKQ